MDIAYPLRVAAAKFRNRDALVYRGHHLTFGQLDEQVDRLARGLDQAGLRGKTIASVLHNDPRTICLYLAAARIGAISVPINNRLTAPELAYIIKDSEADLLFIDSEVLSGAQDLATLVPSELPIVEFDAEYAGTDADFRGYLGETSVEEFASDVDETSAATIIYTSGTSGFPKGVVRSHSANLWATANSLIGSPRDPRGDVELFALPLFGIGFIYQAMPTLLSGGTVILDRIFDPVRTWEILAEQGVTRTFLAPTMIAALLDVDQQEGYDVSHLGTISVAYEFSERLRTRALDRFGDVFINMYGLTEAQLCAGAPHDFGTDPSAAGRPMGLARVRILDENLAPVTNGAVGEIALETPAAMTCYKGLEEETKRVVHGSTVLTGDLGYLDEDGALHFAGRSKEIIKSGGFSIDPVEIENAILQLEFVKEAAVVGLKDEKWGERVVAFVVTADASAPADEIRAHCRSTLASFKVPKEVRFLADLPKNATGKIQRASLRG